MAPLNSTPPSTPPSEPSPIDPGTSPASVARWNAIFYNTSLGLTVLCPVVMLLPPRKLDLYTFGLGITWCVSASYCVERRTGRPLLWHIGDRLPSAANRARHRAEAAGDQGTGTRGGAGLFGSLWPGKRSEGWVEERLRKEREALEQGKGYGSLIKDHIREATGRGGDGTEGS